MSGGAFDYIQYRIDDIITRIEREIHDATKPRPATQTVKYTPVYEKIHSSGAVRLEYHPINHCKDLDEARKFIKKNGIKVIEDDGNKIIFEENGKTRYTYAVQYEEYPDEYDENGFKVYPYYPDYTEDTLQELRNGVEILRKGRIYAQRIDWLLSGDDGEESFHRRLKDELEMLNKESHA